MKNFVSGKIVKTNAIAIKIIFALIVILLPISGFIIGYFYGQNTTKITNVEAEIVTTIPTTTSITSFDPSKNGMIEVALSYPSEGIPKGIKVCAQNIVSNKIICNDQIIINAIKYRNQEGIIVVVPEGKYYVYAQVNSLTAYYTNRGKACAEYDNTNNGLNITNDNCQNFNTPINKVEVDVKINNPQYLGTGIDW